MDQRKDEEGVRDPAVEHLQTLVRHAREVCNYVGLSRSSKDKWHAGQSHPSCSGGDRWGGSVVDIIRVGPIVRLGAQGHGKEEHRANGRQQQHAYGRRVPVQKGYPDGSIR